MMNDQRTDTRLTPYCKVMHKYGDPDSYECMATSMLDPNRLVMRQEEAILTINHHRPNWNYPDPRWRMVFLTWEEILDLRRWEEAMWSNR